MIWGGGTKLLPEKRLDALNFAQKINRFFCRDRQISVISKKKGHLHTNCFIYFLLFS